MPIEYIPHSIQANIRDVSGARVFGANYTNTNLRPFMVLVSIVHTATLAAQNAFVQCTVNGVNSTFSGWFASPAAGSIYGYCLAMVPAGSVYRLVSVVTAPATNVVVTWLEIDL